MKNEDILNSIINTGDIIAKYRTSIDKIDNILKNGFNFEKADLVMQDKNELGKYLSLKDKDKNSNDVIIVIPKSFIKEIRDFDDKDYDDWKKLTKDVSYREFMFQAFSDIVEKEDIKEDEFGLSLPSLTSFHLPKEFVIGYIGEDKGEKVLIDNPNFFDNITKEKQKEFVNDFLKDVEEE